MRRMARSGVQTCSTVTRAGGGGDKPGDARGAVTRSPRAKSPGPSSPNPVEDPGIRRENGGQIWDTPEHPAR